MPHQSLTSTPRPTCLLVAIVLLSAGALSAEDQLYGRSVSDGPIDAVLRVAQHDGGDFTTITPALERAKVLLGQGQAVRIEIGPGIYREHAHLDLPDDSPASEPTLVIQGAGAGRTIISGCDLTGWQADTWAPVDGRPGVYSRAWPHRLGADAGCWSQNFGVLLQGVAARSELLRVGGQRMNPRILDRYEWVDPDGKSGNVDGGGGTADTTNQPGALVFRGSASRGLDVLDRDWTFAISDNDAADPALRHRVFIRVPAATPLAELGEIEVARPPHDRWYWSATLRISRKDNLVLRGLTVTGDANFAPGGGALLHGCRQVLVEDCSFTENVSCGLRIGSAKQRPASRTTLRRCDFSRNGYKGLSGTGDHALVERCTLNFNNWQGAAGGFTSWDTGGVKIGREYHVRFRDCVAVGNLTHGFWHDVFCRDVGYERCIAYGNLRNGFFFELSGEDARDGDDVARACVAARNGDAGYYLSNIRRPLVDGCLAVDNDGAQVRLSQVEERPPYTAAGFENLTLTGNLLIAGNAAPLIEVRNAPDDRGTDLLAALRCVGNRYLSADPRRAFHAQGLPRADVAAWRALVGDAGGSTDLHQVEAIADGRLDLLAGGTPASEWCAAHQLTLPAALIADHEAEFARRLAVASAMDRPWPGDAADAAWRALDLAAAGNRPADGGSIIPHLPRGLLGEQRIYGVPMRIPRGDRAAVAMASTRFAESGGAATPTQVELPIGGSLQRAYVLHATSYIDDGETVGQVELVYADGSTHAIAVTAGDGGTTRDWWYTFAPIETAAARPVPLLPTNPFQVRHAYQLRIDNPAAERSVRAIRFSSDGAHDAGWSIFAVTALP